MTFDIYRLGPRNSYLRFIDKTCVCALALVFLQVYKTFRAPCFANLRDHLWYNAVTQNNVHTTFDI